MAQAASKTEHNRTVDAFLGGLVTLVQPQKGHRAGLDAALLQALVPTGASGRLIDLGAGVGTVAFSVAARAQALVVTGIERDPDLVSYGLEALARPENADFAGRVRLVAADAAAPQDLRARIDLADGNVDWVLMNPPFDRSGRVRQSPDARRREAHVGAEGLFQSWSATAAALLRPGGVLGLIHRAEALLEVADALSRHFGDLRVLPVHPFDDAAASRILVSARRARHAPLTIAPALILHQVGGKWTPEADAILKGEADLAI